MLNFKWTHSLLIVIIFTTIKCRGFVCDKPNLEITVTPIDKHVEVKWELENKRSTDWIGLYGGEIDLTDASKNLMYGFKVKERYGWEKTNIIFNEEIPQEYIKPVILKYRAAYWRKVSNLDDDTDNSLVNVPIVTTQLSTFPNWMEHYWKIIGNKPLNKVFIPGTHDSVSNENALIPIIFPNEWRSVMKGMANMFVQYSSTTLKQVNRIAMTQDKTILEQLLLGIRYLDIRVCYFNETYWTVHGPVKIILLDDVIKQVVEFVTRTEKEIVLFDIHEMTDVPKEEYKNFIKFIRSKFTHDGKKLWVPLKTYPHFHNASDTTLERILNNHNGGKVIISHINKELFNQGKGLFWPFVKHIWGNKDKLHELIIYFEDVYENDIISTDIVPEGLCHSAMAQLTAKLEGVRTGYNIISSGLDIQAESNCRSIYKLFMRQEIGPKLVAEKFNKINYYILLTLVLLQFKCIHVSVNGEYACTKPHLEITVSALNKHIHVHWNLEKIKEDDWVGLYKNMFSESKPNHNLLTKESVYDNIGVMETNVYYEYDEPSNVNDTCLKYYAVYWRTRIRGNSQNSYNKVVVSTCLSNHPRWMEHYWELISDRPINTLFIPGTHDSASYEGLDHNPFQKMGKWFRRTALFTFIKHCKQEILPLVNLYALTQDQNIYDQLMFGIRYLDIRVFRVERGGYWACHGPFLMVRLENIIKDVIEFVTQTKKEIVIFDIHQLKSGFRRDKDHAKFILWLKEKFMHKNEKLWIGYLPNNSWNSSLNDLIKHGGRIILTYANENYQRNYSDFLWPCVLHFWGNKQEPEDLVNYLKTTIERTYSMGYAAMAQLTMNVRYVTKTIFNFQPGLRRRANAIAPHIYSLYRDYEVAKRTNILAVDFARSMGAVRAALIWNERFSLNIEYGNTEKEKCDPISTYYDTYYQNNPFPVELL